MSESAGSSIPWQLLNMIWGTVSLAFLTAAGAMARTFRRHSERLHALEEKRAADVIVDAAAAATRRELAERVQRLEAASAATAVMADSVARMSATLEGFREQMGEHHRENQDKFDKERRDTWRWREEIMAPLITNVHSQLAVTGEQLRTHERRLAELENHRGQPR